MIKTPVKMEIIEGCNVISESDGSMICDAITTDLASEISKRINMHDELINVISRIRNNVSFPDDLEIEIDELLEETK